MNYGEATKILEATFNQEDFNEHNFKKFIHELFAREINIKDRHEIVDGSYSDKIESCKIIADLVDSQKQEMLIAVVRLKRSAALDRARNMQRDFIAKLLEHHYKSHALVAFVSSDEANWRFSLVKQEFEMVEQDQKVKSKKILSPARRFSFLVGKNEGSHTVRSRFLKILNNEKSRACLQNNCLDLQANLGESQATIFEKYRDISQKFCEESRLKESQSEANRQSANFSLKTGSSVAPTIAEIEEAFNIETITDEFFEKYKELYHRFHEALDSFLEANETEKKHFKEKEISTSDFAKKTLGQIVFLYFLQKKGWFGVRVGEAWGSGDKNFLANYFTKNKNHKNFFNDCLEPLFYEALAVDRGPESIYSKIDNLRFPFLNGGLFEPIRDYSWEKTKLNLPNELFSNDGTKKNHFQNQYLVGEPEFTSGKTIRRQNKFAEANLSEGDGIFDIFNRYNFTVNENEPLENEVAIDPEMLGKVFENLLEIKDRKSKGAFYTPRPIVHYMCQEALIHYLQQQTSLPQSDLSAFVKNRQISPVIEKANSQIDKLLENVKICDPAIGSGAFALGALNEIVGARLTLAKLQDRNSPQNSYQFKLHAISNSIYGVDLEPSAVEIAKLRLWLSLVVEEQEPRPLPNLEYKIMQGNSLLETIEGIKLFDDEKVQEIADLFDKSVKNIADKKIELQHKIKNFFAENRRAQKLELKKQIDELKWQLIEATLIAQKKQDKLAEIQNLRRQNIRQFFLWRLEFGEVFKTCPKSSNCDEPLASYSALPLLDVSQNTSALQFSNRPLSISSQRDFEQVCDAGFDVVIGNPPYIQLQKDGGALADMFEKSGFESFVRSGDIYCLFYEAGASLLKKHGALVFITSNKWMRAGYGEKLRKFLSEKTTPKILIDLGPGVFATATVDTNILLFEKSLPTVDNKACLACSVKENLAKTNQKLEDYLAKNQFFVPKFCEQSWIIANSLEARIKAKIEKAGVKLKDWDIKINYGIKTGFNEAFIIDTKTKEELCLADPKSAEIIKPILRGRDISRYCAKWAGLWVINSHNGYKKPRNISVSTQNSSNDKDFSIGVIAKECLKSATEATHEKSLDCHAQPAVELAMTPKEGSLEKEVELVPRINVEKDYPAIFAYLQKFQSQLEKRADKGEHWTNLRNCAYLEEFEKEKIVYSEIVREPQFYLDDKGFFPEATSFLMTGKDVKFIVAILNSKAFTYFFNRFYAGGGLGDEGFRYKKKFLEQVPIPQLPFASQSPFITIVDEILAITNKPDYNPVLPPLQQKQLEAKIDEMVCDLYGLDEEERALILKD